MYTNAHDLHNFWTRLFSFKIIEKENLQNLTNQENPFDDISGYGMGIYTGKYREYNCFSATGADAGVGFISQYIPKTQTIINILSNHTEGNKGIINFFTARVKMVSSRL